MELKLTQRAGIPDFYLSRALRPSLSLWGGDGETCLAFFVLVDLLLINCLLSDTALHWFGGFGGGGKGEIESGETSDGGWVGSGKGYFPWGGCSVYSPKKFRHAHLCVCVC